MPGPSAAKPRPAKRRWLEAALLLGLALVTYARAFGSGWMWDDDANVTECAPVLAWNGLATLWLDPRAIQQYYPVLHTVFWIEHKLWGLQPMGYHAVNVLLHALNAILFWRLLAALRLPDRAAWTAGLLFVVHPVHVESVAWITEMKNTLSLTFALAGARVWLAWAGLTDPPPPERSRRRLLILFYLLFALALLAKSVTMTLPIVLLILAWWKRGRWKRRAWSLAPCLVAAMAFALLTIQLERENVGVAQLQLPLSPAQRVLLAGHALGFYAAKLAWPRELSFVYPRWRLDPASWSAWLFPLGALIVVGALLEMRRRIGRGPAAAALIWIAMLAPMLGFVDIFWFRYGDVSDHFQYHASLAPLAIAGVGLASAASFLDRRWKPAGAALVTAVIVALAWLSAERVRAFHDSTALWTDTLRQNPDAWIAWNNLGRLTLDAGRSDEAEPMLRRAIAIDDRQHEPWNNLGICLMNRGRPDDALAAFRRALALHPNGVSERENLGRALLLHGDWPEAVTVLRDVLADRRHGADAELDLGEALARSGRWSEAESVARGGHRRFPSDTRFHLLLGVTLRRQGALAEARRVLEEAAALGGRRDPVVLDALAISLASAGAFEDAARVEAEAFALHAGPGADAVLERHLAALRRREVPR
jgi:Flp pilus assembly protein TadD